MIIIYALLSNSYILKLSYVIPLIKKEKGE